MDTSDIEKIVKKEFGVKPEEVDEIEEGLKQETYSVKVSGENYIIQLSDKLDEGDNGLERCVKTYQLMKETEVPVPELYTDNLRKYTQNDETWKYYIAEKINGKSLESQLTPELTVKSGIILANIHDFRSFDESGWLLPEEAGFSVVPFEEGGFKEYVLENWQDSIQTFEEEGWNGLVEKSRRFYDAYAEELPEDIEPVFCQDDFSTQNIMVDEGEITGIIDFDMAHSGHNQRDLVKAANSFWMIDPGPESELREKLYEGYRQERELEASFNTNEPIYRVETLSGLVSGLIRMNHFSEYEKEFYRENLLRIIQEAEKELEKA